MISIIGRTLQPFDDDNLIPTFGFGDASTGDKTVFPFLPAGKPCRGFDEVLRRYDEITPGVALAGPTNFAPIIYEAIRQVTETRSYHILVIIAGACLQRASTRSVRGRSASDSQTTCTYVTVTVTMRLQWTDGQVTNEKETAQAIVEASNYALCALIATHARALSRLPHLLRLRVLDSRVLTVACR